MNIYRHETGFQEKSLKLLLVYLILSNAKCKTSSTGDDNEPKTTFQQNQNSEWSGCKLTHKTPAKQSLDLQIKKYII